MTNPGRDNPNAILINADRARRYNGGPRRAGAWGPAAAPLTIRAAPQPVVGADPPTTRGRSAEQPPVASRRQKTPNRCATMQNSMGIESIVLVRETSMARRPALAFSSGADGTNPSAFFWFGQMMNQTLKAMISASHMPMPMP